MPHNTAESAQEGHGHVSQKYQRNNPKNANPIIQVLLPPTCNVL